eukprot:1182031-Prorocentrum_minimum.AAC.2
MPCRYPPVPLRSSIPNRSKGVHDRYPEGRGSHLDAAGGVGIARGGVNGSVGQLAARALQQAARGSMPTVLGERPSRGRVGFQSLRSRRRRTIRPARARTKT